MRKLIILISAAFSAAFFGPSTTMAQNGSCDAVAQENVLLKGISESPDLLIKVIEGDALVDFWAKMRDQHYLLGVMDVDKVYIFKSENHPDQVYVFYLRDGCVKNVQMTFRNVIEGLIS